MKYHNQHNAVLFSALLMLAALAVSLVLPLSASAATGGMDRNVHPPLHRTVAFHADNGKVTDGDGIIGNSLYGADARHPHAHSKMTPAKRGARHMAGAVAGAVDRAAGGVKRVTNGVLNGAEQALDGIGNAARNAAQGITGRNIDGTNDTTAENNDGTVTEDNNGTATENGGAMNDNNAPATDDQTPVDPGTEENLPGDPVNPGTPEAATTPNDDAMEPEANEGRGVIGWVIAILVIIAGALVVLALLPKKQHDRR